MSGTIVSIGIVVGVSIALSMLGMGIGLLFRRPCLRGSCGGSGGCTGCPNRRSSDD